MRQGADAHGPSNTWLRAWEEMPVGVLLPPGPGGQESDRDRAWDVALPGTLKRLMLCAQPPLCTTGRA